jgi:cytosine/adenosine deaminase-related metal-dependent hydrolase
VRLHLAPWIVPVVTPPIRDGAVLVDERGVVQAVGRFDELRERSATLVHHEGVLMPGVVNAHAHVELSHLAGRVPGGDGLVPWIRRLLAERALAPRTELHEAAQALASRGTVAVAEIANDGAALPALREAGLDVVHFDEKIAPLGPPAPTRPGATGTPHATYTCGPEALRALAHGAGGRIATIHVEEDPAEAMLLVEGDGPVVELLVDRGRAPLARAPRLRPIPWLDALGVLGPGTLLVHLTFADDASLRLAAERRAIAVLCPRSNCHITGRLPPVQRIRTAGLRVALGSDSLASSPSLDVLADVAVLARQGVDPWWLVEAATVGGAIALERPQLGAIAPLRRPGLLELGDNGRSLFDPVSFIAHEGAAAPARVWERPS